jgi:uncharacterized protein YggE
MDHHIVVRGTGTVRAMPDRAVLRVKVEADGSTRDDAYNQAAPAASRIDEVVASYESAIERSSVAALVVHPTSRWDDGREIRTGWRASRTSILEVVDFGRLGDLIAELASGGGAVSGPDWQLDPANAASAEARRLAAEDARRRGDGYASALGLRITAVAWVAEPGLRGGDDVARFDMATSARALGAAPEMVIAVTPDELDVHGVVDVAFDFASA